jgi:hypothetical protein
MTDKKVSIRHRPGTYNVYRNLSNKVWYALAEFVDNALQSFESNKRTIKRIDGEHLVCKIDITINPGREIVIRDNAGGISEKDFVRAFEPANKPDDDDGLSEFGMGLKVASIWFADNYIVRTSAIGEPVIKQVEFDLSEVVELEMEELSVKESSASPDLHFTEVILSKLSKNAPTGNPRQMAKIKSHLASIYRVFIRKKRLELTLNGELLSYENPKVLVAPIWNKPNGEPVKWLKKITIEAGPYKIKGFIGLLETMKQEHAGLSLFRRGRVIEGSHDEKFRHKLLTGSPGSPRDKRLFGELELTGFEVSFEKGRFIGNRDFDSIFKLVSDELKGKEFPLLQQGDNYRKKPLFSSEDTAKTLAKTLRTESTTQKSPVSLKLPTAPPKFRKAQLDPSEVLDAGTWSARFGEHEYDVHLVITHRVQDHKLYYIDDVKRDNSKKTTIVARLNMEHDFFKSNESRQKPEVLEAIARIVQSLALAEVYGPTIGLKNEGILRDAINSILAKQ